MRRVRSMTSPAQTKHKQQSAARTGDRSASSYCSAVMYVLLELRWRGQQVLSEVPYDRSMARDDEELSLTSHTTSSRVRENLSVSLLLVLLLSHIFRGLL